MAPEVVNQYIVYTGSGTVGTTLRPQNLTENTANINTVAYQILSSNDIFEICIYLVILTMGVIGNGLVIFVTGYKMKTTVNSVWFLNLAIADFIFVFCLIINIIFTFNNKVWPFDDSVCKFTSLVTVLNMFASSFLLTAISLDRCLCTWLIVWAQNKRTLNKARIICIFVWILSICCSIPYVMQRSVQEQKGLKQCVYKSQNQTDRDVLMSLFTYRFLGGFLIPFLIIASSYIAIGVRVKRLKIGKQLRPFRVILSVILAFFLCWFPFHVQQLCHISALKYKWSNHKVIDSAGPFIQCLAYLNSCLNPILYVFMCDEYKKKLKKSLLLVFEAAFTEDLPCRSTLHSTLRYSESQQSKSGKQTNDTTISSSGSGQGNKLLNSVW
ncbi:C3a anaphylatoxin chemotactic receptor-like [Misgurnus anguillicaudatus]|uniref:C3a anaphylatoxin chemotactic receptor-like n=1 Tax=Misgurnus anguillicaudatus TaxID=75329 RepID=UPI003CCF05F5